jgi:hypothetical protein
LVDPQACVERTKTLRAENFLQGILCANEAAGGAKFVVPNLVIFPASPSTAIRARWHVPVDDISHVELTFHYRGKSPTIGDPMSDAKDVLFKAMEVARSGESRGHQL